MRRQFVKMQGAGNDFVVLDARTEPLSLDATTARRLADRRYGIGCDQILLLEPAVTGDVLAAYRIFNADGGEVEQCGNGVRCLGALLASGAGEFALQSPAGRTPVRVGADGAVAVAMGAPNFDPASLPFDATGRARQYDVEVEGEEITIGAVSVGNPHAVVEVDDIDTAPVERVGAALQNHPRFPRGVNVGFLEIVDEQNLRLRVYERGVGETLACGTGACAAQAVARDRSRTAARVCLALPGGRLVVSWAGPDQELWLSGPAESVFEGTIEL